MKKLLFTLGAMLVFGIASAQYNSVSPSTAASPAPGTPVIQNQTDMQIQQQSNNGAPTQLITAPPVYNSPSTALPQQPATVDAINNSNSYPGSTLAYPKAQGNIEPGTGTSTTQPVNGTNNQESRLPASTTSNQGKLP